jgi:nicotinamidase-related amidase
MSQALIVVDVQNEFSPHGKRAVPNHAAALAVIKQQVEEARQQRKPIGWVLHYNKPHESPAFVPNTWGAELSPGLLPDTGSAVEAVFRKDVFGAFTGTNLESWLRSVGADSVLLVGFYTHMCVSTTAREALVRGFEVAIDADATGAQDLAHPVLGAQTADEVRRSALLQLTNMGVRLNRTVLAVHDLPNPPTPKPTTVCAPWFCPQ